MYVPYGTCTVVQGKFYYVCVEIKIIESQLHTVLNKLEILTVRYLCKKTINQIRINFIQLIMTRYHYLKNTTDFLQGLAKSLKRRELGKFIKATHEHTWSR